MAVELNFIQDTVDEYDALTQMAQFADVQQPITLPAGKVWHGSKGTYTVDQLLALGYTHVSKFDIQSVSQARQTQLFNQSKVYNDPMGNLTMQQFNLSGNPIPANWFPPENSWPYIWNANIFPTVPGQTEPLTAQQGYDKGLLFSDLFSMVIFENAEQEHAISPHWAFRKTFYDALVPRMVAKHGTIFLADNYYSGIGGRPDWMTRAEAKQRLRDPFNLWPGNPMLPGGTMEKCTMSCYGGYFKEPDTMFLHLYAIPYSGLLNRKAGKFMVGFIQSFHEWRPNNFYDIDYPEGDLVWKGKMPINPVYLISMTVLFYIYGCGVIGYGYDAKRGDKKLVRQYAEGAMWYPNGSSSPVSLDQFPYWTPEGGGYYFGYNGSADMTAEGVRMYANTWALTEGGTEYYCDFQLDGGSWITAANAEADDIVDACFDNRGWVLVRVKGSVMSVLYINPNADNQEHTLVFRHPTDSSKTYTGTVSTPMVHVCNVNI